MFAFQVAMEHFVDPSQLQGAVVCSDDCAAIVQRNTVKTAVSYESSASQGWSSKQDLTVVNVNREQGHVYTTNPEPPWPIEEGESLGEVSSNIAKLLEETKQALYRTKEIKNSVLSNRDATMERTKKLFNAFRRKINEREQQILEEIKQAADKKERAIKVTSYKINVVSHSQTTFSFASGQ